MRTLTHTERLVHGINCAQAGDESEFRDFSGNLEIIRQFLHNHSWQRCLLHKPNLGYSFMLRSPNQTAKWANQIRRSYKNDQSNIFVTVYFVTVYFVT